MIAAFLLSLLAQTGECKSGMTCRSYSFQPPCVTTAQLPTCGTSARGRMQCDSTRACWVYCNGTAWSCVATALTAANTSGWTSDGGTTVTTQDVSMDGTAVSLRTVKGFTGLMFSGGNVGVDNGDFRVVSNSGSVHIGTTNTSNLLIAYLDSNGKHSSAAISGNNAFEATVNGARFDFGAGASDYASSNGTLLTFAGQVSVVSDFYTGTGNRFSVGAGTGNVTTDGKGFFGSDVEIPTNAAYYLNGATHTAYMFYNGTNIIVGTPNGLLVTGDVTTPARAGFGISPQDAEPTGPNSVGNMYVTTAGVLMICTVAGSPGTWVSVGSQ